MAESPYQISAILSVGEANASFAAWTSATTLNTTAILVSNDYSYNTINVSLNQTTTITGGVVTFQGSFDGTTYFNIQGFSPGSLVSVGPTYALQQSTYATFQFNLTGIPYFQVLLSTVITGTGTVTVGYAADSFPYVVGVAAAQNGVWTVTQSGNWTTRILGNAGAILDASVTANTAPANGVAVLGVSPSVTPTLSGGQSAALQLDISGRLNTDTQSWAGTQLATPQTFGTAPTGVVIGTSSDIYVAGTRARSNQTTTAAGVQDVNIVGSLGVTNSATNGTFIAITDNTTKVAVIAGTAALKTDMSSVAGTATATAAAGVQKVGVVGNAGATLDTPVASASQPANVVQIGGWVTGSAPTYATATANTISLDTAGNVRVNVTNIVGLEVAQGGATAAANALQVAGVYNSTLPTLTTGEGGAVQLDAKGQILTDLSYVGGTVAQLAAAGTQLVGVVGATGRVMDAAVTAATAPSNGIATLGVYNSAGVAPTTGQSVAMQLDQDGNHLQFPGVQQSTGAAWSSATTINTLQYATGTATQGQLVGIPAVVVQLVQTTTLTGGAVTFQGTYDNVHWVTIPVAQIINPNTFAQLTNPYTFVASTNQPFLILLQGYCSVRLNLTTVITGTGTVTPYWATLPDNPITTTVVTGTSSTGSIQVSVVPSANTYFRFGNVTTASSSTNAKVESTTYTEQSTAVQRSISSSSANDTSAGTGARTVQITYYDASGNGPFTETDTLNGTTAVNTTATNICFIEMIQVLTVGSTGSNVGTITLFAATAGGGGAIGTVAATTNRTFWAHHYVPSGKTFHLTGVNVGSNSTTGGNGGNFTLFAQTLPVANQVNNQISDNLLLYGQSSNTTRTYNSPIAVAGPARVTMFVLPLPNATVTYYGSFDFFEQ